MEHNPTFIIGLPKDKQKRIRFPEFMVGGGCVWLEAFTKNDPATGKVPNGLFIRATGTPRIVRVAWTDWDGEPIAGNVKFGSTVLLNIYTEHLYGQDIEVTLWDEDTLDGNDLLRIDKEKYFSTEVLLFDALPKEIGQGNVSNDITVDGKPQPKIQKVRIPVLERVDN